MELCSVHNRMQRVLKLPLASDLLIKLLSTNKKNKVVRVFTSLFNPLLPTVFKSH